MYQQLTQKVLHMPLRDIPMEMFLMQELLQQIPPLLMVTKLLFLTVLQAVSLSEQK